MLPQKASNNAGLRAMVTPITPFLQIYTIYSCFLHTIHENHASYVKYLIILMYILEKGVTGENSSASRHKIKDFEVTPKKIKKVLPSEESYGK